MSLPLDLEAFRNRLAEAFGDESTKSIADRSDVSESLLRKYLRGDSSPGLENLAAIASTLGVSLDWLVEGKESNPTGPSGDGAASTWSGVPIVSSVPAGPMQLFDVMDHPDEIVPVSREAVTRRGDRPFGLRIEGDSMEPWMLHRDIVVCSTIETPEVGDDVVLFQYASQESTVKRLTALNRTQKQSYVQLTPLNARYDPFRVDLQEGDSLHKVLLVVRVAGRRRAR